MATEIKDGSNILLRMHPLQRMFISIVPALITGYLLRNTNYSILFKIICGWGVFALLFIITSWIIFFTRSVNQIKKFARKDDGSRVFVILSTIFTAFAAMVTVLLLVIDSGADAKKELSLVGICFASVLLSWAMVHTILTFHYAHIYYDDDEEGKEVQRGGLEFPEEKKPDYLDFAYFSFVVGMTFQVSDVQVTDKKLRRMVLVHGLVAFALNTFVVALTINFIAGLSK